MAAERVGGPPDFYCQTCGHVFSPSDPESCCTDACEIRVKSVVAEWGTWKPLVAAYVRMRRTLA